MSGDQNLISFGEVHINSMDSSYFSAGGLNVASGWSAHSKENTGIRYNSKGGQLHHNVSIVYDSDLVDAYIDDRDLKVTNGEHYTGKTTVNLELVDVLNMVQNSGIFVGNSSINGMDSHTKDNFATGPIRGHENKLFYNTNITNDRDLVDTPIQDNDIKYYKKYGEEKNEGDWD